jgi:hypothetical protein
VWPAEDKRLPPEKEALSGTYTDGLPGCVVNREDDTGLLALWRYQVCWLLALPACLASVAVSAGASPRCCIHKELTSCRVVQGFKL